MRAVRNYLRDSLSIALLRLPLLLKGVSPWV